MVTGFKKNMLRGASAQFKASRALFLTNVLIGSKYCPILLESAELKF